MACRVHSRASRRRGVLHARPTCLEVDIASQGHALDEARDNLAEALALHFEDEDVHIGDPPVIVPIDIAV